MEAENQLTQGLRQLFAVAEAYPDLKANQNFLDLQNKLSGVEDSATNGAALLQRHRAGIQRPGRLVPELTIASRYGYTPATFVEGDPADRAVPEVAFNKPA